MKYLIIRKYKTSEENNKKYNLECNERIVAYDYINKLFISYGIPEEHTNFKEILKNNKHRLTFIRRCKQ